MKTKSKIPVAKLKVGPPYNFSVLKRRSNEHPDDKLVSAPIRTLGHATILGPSGSGKLKHAYSVAAELGYTYIELVNAKQLSGALRDPIIGDIRDFETLSPLFTERTQKTKRAIILKEIGYLTFLEQVSLLAYIRSVLDFDEAEGLPQSDNIVIATSTLPLSEFGSEDAVFHPFIEFLSKSVIQLEPLKANPDRIPSLANSILASEAKRLGKPTIISISDEVMGHLKKYEWPGNIRELKA